jgi:hypothetical protein
MLVLLLAWGDFLGQDLAQKFEKIGLALNILCNLFIFSYFTSPRTKEQ